MGEINKKGSRIDEKTLKFKNIKNPIENIKNGILSCVVCSIEI